MKKVLLESKLKDNQICLGLQLQQGVFCFDHLTYLGHLPYILFLLINLRRRILL